MEGYGKGAPKGEWGKWGHMDPAGGFWTFTPPPPPPPPAKGWGPWPVEHPAAQWGPYTPHPPHPFEAKGAAPTGYGYDETVSLEGYLGVEEGGVDETPGDDEVKTEEIDPESEKHLQGYNFIQKRIKGTVNNVGEEKTGFTGHIMIHGTHSALVPFHTSNFLSDGAQELYSLLEEDQLVGTNVSFFVDHYGVKGRPTAVAIKKHKVAVAPKCAPPAHLTDGRKGKIKETKGHKGNKGRW